MIKHPSSPPVMTLLITILTIYQVHAEFNYEIGHRVHERLSSFILTPSRMLRLISSQRSNQAFPNDLRAPDRDVFLRYNVALRNTYPEFEVYYGLEDGVLAGSDREIADYREPGESGYPVDNEDNAGVMQKYYMACVNSSGGEIPCKMKVGGTYTECVNGCALEKCPDTNSQRDCSALGKGGEEMLACESKIKWCKSYVFKEAPIGVPLGFVPRSYYCLDSDGIPTQVPGEVVKKGTDELGNCYSQDGTTLVNRNLVGDYAFCGVDGEACNNTFTGAYRSRDYDPRWRGWYIATRSLQEPNWSPPYIFFSAQELGITFSLPIYTVQDDNRTVFEGVLAVDYTFKGVTSFLQNSYQNSSIVVAVFEKNEPNYIVATSTGSKLAKQVLSSDSSQQCTDPINNECEAVRIPIAELSENRMDRVISKAYLKQRSNGFPSSELATITSEDTNLLYASQTKSFSSADAGLDWRIMIMTPVETEQMDQIMPGDSLFTMLVSVVAVGFFICTILVGLLLKNRKHREIMISDWRFMSAFVFACALLNVSCLSFIGPNTDLMCLLRMWLVHMCFVLPLALLFVKIYRTYKIVGGVQSFRRTVVTHAQTAKMAIPFILVQIIILLIFTFIDPSKQVEIVESVGSDITHRLICANETYAFFATMVTYEGGLILVGCVLAYKTRDLRSEFNESKQIIFAMYDIAVVGSILLVVSNAAIMYQGPKRLLFSVGIFWATCFASCIFVLPRLMQVSKEDNRESARVSVSTNRTSNN